MDQVQHLFAGLLQDASGLMPAAKSDDGVWWSWIFAGCDLAELWIGRISSGVRNPSGQSQAVLQKMGTGPA